MVNLVLVGFIVIAAILIAAFAYQLWIESKIQRVNDLQFWTPRIALPSISFTAISSVISIICDLYPDVGWLIIIRGQTYDCGTLGGYAMVFFVVMNAVKNSWMVTNIADHEQRTVSLQYILVVTWSLLCVIQVATHTARAVLDQQVFVSIFLFGLAFSLVVALAAAWFSLWRMRLKLLELQTSNSGLSTTGESILDKLAPFYRFMGLATVVLCAAAVFQCLNAITNIQSSTAYYRPSDSSSSFDPFLPIMVLAWSLVLYFSWKSDVSDADRQTSIHSSSGRKSASVMPLDTPSNAADDVVAQP